MTSGHRLLFFAVGNDILDALAEVWAEKRLRLFHTYVADSDVPVVIERLQDVPHLGVSRGGDTHDNQNYLVLPENEKVRARKIDLRGGGVEYAYQEDFNPFAAHISFGGVLGRAVISGVLNTMGQTPEAKSLFLTLKRPIKKKFRYMSPYYVGPEAEALLRKGYRLTQRVQAPEEYDLHLEHYE